MSSWNVLKDNPYVLFSRYDYVKSEAKSWRISRLTNTTRFNNGQAMLWNGDTTRTRVLNPMLIFGYFSNYLLLN